MADVSTTQSVTFGELATISYNASTSDSFALVEVQAYAPSLNEPVSASEALGDFDRTFGDSGILTERIASRSFRIEDFGFLEDLNGTGPSRELSESWAATDTASAGPVAEDVFTLSEADPITGPAADDQFSLSETVTINVVLSVTDQTITFESGVPRASLTKADSLSAADSAGMGFLLSATDGFHLTEKRGDLIAVTFDYLSMADETFAPEVTLSTSDTSTASESTGSETASTTSDEISATSVTQQKASVGSTDVIGFQDATGARSFTIFEWSTVTHQIASVEAVSFAVSDSARAFESAQPGASLSCTEPASAGESVASGASVSSQDSASCQLTVSGTGRTVFDYSGISEEVCSVTANVSATDQTTTFEQGTTDFAVLALDACTILEATSTTATLATNDGLFVSNQITGSARATLEFWSATEAVAVGLVLVTGQDGARTIEVASPHAEVNSSDAFTLVESAHQSVLFSLVENVSAIAVVAGTDRRLFEWYTALEVSSPSAAISGEDSTRTFEFVFIDALIPTVAESFSFAESVTLRVSNMAAIDSATLEENVSPSFLIHDLAYATEATDTNFVLAENFFLWEFARTPSPVGDSFSAAEQVTVGVVCADFPTLAEATGLTMFNAVVAFERARLIEVAGTITVLEPVSDSAFVTDQAKLGVFHAIWDTASLSAQAHNSAMLFAYDGTNHKERFSIVVYFPVVLDGALITDNSVGGPAGALFLSNLFPTLPIGG